MEFQVTWFVLWAVLWAVYFMLDGFVLGTGMLHHYLGRNDQDRKILIRSVGPVWDGNEVWLLTAGGATFAAFPTTYALMFSYLYSALLLLLFALIIRGVSLEFRGKIGQPGLEKGLGYGHLHRKRPSGASPGRRLRQHLQRSSHGRGRISRLAPFAAESLRPADRRSVRTAVPDPRQPLRLRQDRGASVRYDPRPWPASSGSPSWPLPSCSSWPRLFRQSSMTTT